MGTIGFGHVNLRTQRPLLDQLYDFYTSVVGLAEGPRPPFARFGYWLYADGQDIVHLIEASLEEKRATGITTTIDHIAFRCEGRDEFEKRLEQQGVQYRVATVPLTGQLQLVLKDPAGNTVELNFPATEA
jgi:glyoxylase I family protein